MKKAIVICLMLLIMGCATTQPKPSEPVTLSEQEAKKAKQANRDLVGDIISVISGSVGWFIIH